MPLQRTKTMPAGGPSADRSITLVTIPGSLVNRSISAARPLLEVAEIVSAGRVVILKGVFQPAGLLDFRRTLMDWAARTAPFPHDRPASALTDTNYHRIDDDTGISITPHRFHQFGFLRLDRLPQPLREPAELMAHALAGLQNAVAGTQFDVSPVGLRLKVLHYPSGGGFLVEHVHSFEPQRVGLIASMSGIGKDFQQGAAVFQTPFGRVDVTGDHDIGDIVLFRYDLPHAVTAVDAGQDLNWVSQSGKWSLVLDLKDSYVNSRATPTNR